MKNPVEYRVDLELISSAKAAAFADVELEQVSVGIVPEDMVPVSPEILRSSDMAFGGYVALGGREMLVGFARQLQRTSIAVPEERQIVRVAEIGTVWVDPEYRRHGVGREVIKFATEHTTRRGFVPLAVCNGESRKVFERVGYEPIAEMRGAGGQPRIVELFPDGPAIAGSDDTRLHAVKHLKQLPRFDDIKLLS